MEFMLLIYEDEAVGEAMTGEESEQRMSAYGEYTRELIAAGVMKHGAPLHPVSTATTVRVRDGATSTTDGPFAETREQLGGYYLLDCEDLAAALAWAAKVPSATQGSIEVRPIIPMGPPQ